MAKETRQKKKFDQLNWNKDMEEFADTVLEVYKQDSVIGGITFIMALVSFILIVLLYLALLLGGI